MNNNESSANLYRNITTNGTTVIALPNNPVQKYVLVAIVVNTKGSSSNTATLYDSNTTIGANPDNKIATIDTTASVGRINYGVPLFNGVYIVTATGTAADLTLIYAVTP